MYPLAKHTHTHTQLSLCTCCTHGSACCEVAPDYPEIIHFMFSYIFPHLQIVQIPDAQIYTSNIKDFPPPGGKCCTRGSACCEVAPDLVLSVFGRIVSISVIIIIISSIIIIVINSIMRVV